MSRQYTHVQGLLPSVIAMKEKGYTYRQIADQFGMDKQGGHHYENLLNRQFVQNQVNYRWVPEGHSEDDPFTVIDLGSLCSLSLIFQMRFYDFPLFIHYFIASHHTNLSLLRIKKDSTFSSNFLLVLQVFSFSRH